MRWIGSLVPWLLATLFIVGLLLLDRMVTTPLPISPSRLVLFVIVLVTVIGIWRQRGTPSAGDEAASTTAGGEADDA